VVDEPVAVVVEAIEADLRSRAVHRYAGRLSAAAGQAGDHRIAPLDAIAELLVAARRVVRRMYDLVCPLIARVGGAEHTVGQVRGVRR
jgi:hypothetical protein